MTEAQASAPVPDILRRIVTTKRAELEALRPAAPELRARAAEAAPLRDFEAALRRPGEVALVAEVKRRSPGAGGIRPGLDPAELAVAYSEAGAAALSVLTDGPWFGGSLEDLAAARAATRIPVLRKDFTLDPVHVFEARAAGADAVLLIVRILDDPTLATLLETADEVGVAALVEAHDAREVERALALGARILGINNRDLATFTTDLATTTSLLGDVPAGVTVVSESGIRTPGDVAGLGEAGVDAVLVGEALLASEDPGGAAAALAGAPRRPRGEGGGQASGDPP